MFRCNITNINFLLTPYRYCLVGICSSDATLGSGVSRGGRLFLFAFFDLVGLRRAIKSALSTATTTRTTFGFWFVFSNASVSAYEEPLCEKTLCRKFRADWVLYVTASCQREEQHCLTIFCSSYELEAIHSPSRVFQRWSQGGQCPRKLFPAWVLPLSCLSMTHDFLETIVPSSRRVLFWILISLLSRKHENYVR